MPDVVPVGGPPFKRILCAVDFSASSVNALEHAASLAEEADATLTLLQVIEQDVVDSSAMPAAELYSGAPDGEAALRQLRRIVPSEVRTYAEVREVVTAGKAHQEILRHARDDGAELIVMGAHGGHLIAAIGSTTDRVLREATCPVLTVKG
jgi:nucleotide-binding universal stress UspA family protein